MFVSPLLLTFQRDLVILGIRRNLLAVIIGAAPTLALRLTADNLLGTETEGRNELWQSGQRRRWLKPTPQGSWDEPLRRINLCAMRKPTVKKSI
jgi:hypothetical protein